MSENNEIKTDSKSSENKITDDYYSTNDYNGKDKVYQVKFDGETIWKVHAKLKYGEFGEAHKKIVEETGCKNFNVKFEYGGEPEHDQFGVLTPQGLVLWDTWSTKVIHFNRTNNKAAQDIALKDEEKDPIEAPPGPYKLQPENQGVIIWLTGCPGSGKSTSAQMLARDLGFVFYEGDCFQRGRNPYIPLDIDNPTCAQDMQRKLTGEGWKERNVILKNRDKGNDDDEGLWWVNGKLQENQLKYFDALCDDIKAERKRIGGHWVIADADLIKKSVRDFINSKFGNESVILDLSMTKDDLRERLNKRHEVKDVVEWLMDLSKYYNPVEEDEENVLKVEIDSSMNKADVIDKIKNVCFQHFSKKHFDNSYIESELSKKLLIA